LLLITALAGALFLPGLHYDPRMGQRAASSANMGERISRNQGAFKRRRLAMGRTWVIATTILIVGKMLSVAAQEQNARWCAYFSGGPVNCGFATFEECLKAIHGKTGLCQQYLPPAEPNPGSSGNIHRRHSGAARARA
jgi:hypothetical protein